MIAKMAKRKIIKVLGKNKDYKYSKTVCALDADNMNGKAHINKKTR